MNEADVGFVVMAHILAIVIVTGLLFAQGREDLSQERDDEDFY